MAKWVIGSQIQGVGFHLFDEDAGCTVAWVQPTPDAVEEETGQPTVAGKFEDNGTARLLAAAPELLEALAEIAERARMRYPHFESGAGAATLARVQGLLGRF